MKSNKSKSYKPSLAIQILELFLGINVFIAIVTFFFTVLTFGSSLNPTRRDVTVNEFEAGESDYGLTQFRKGLELDEEKYLIKVDRKLPQATLEIKDLENETIYTAQINYSSLDSKFDLQENLTSNPSLGTIKETVKKLNNSGESFVTYEGTRNFFEDPLHIVSLTKANIAARKIEAYKLLTLILVTSAQYMISCNLLHKLVRNFKRGSFFSLENSKLISNAKTIGNLMVGFNLATYALFTPISLFANADYTNVVKANTLPIVILTVVFATLTSISNEIIKRGVELQVEKDLTI